MKTQNNGITLIELMIVVAIVGILASVAYPSYQSYLQSGRREAAREYILLSILKDQAKYKQGNRKFSDDFRDFGYAAADVSADGSLFKDDLYQYKLSHPGGDESKLKVVATPINNHQDDLCGNLEMEMPGYKTSSSKPGSSSKNCWKVEL